MEITIGLVFTQSLLLHKIEKVSQEYGVSEGLMTYIVQNESRFDNWAVGDQHLVDPNGKPHISRGLVQINQYWNPNVTPREAFDPEFSLRFLAQRLREGKCYLWSTCPIKNGKDIRSNSKT